jgi:glutaredoxin 3
MPTNVIVYIKEGCPYCINAEGLLKSRNIKYKRIVYSNLTDRQKTNVMKKIGSNYIYYPKILVNNVFIGGYDDLKKLI